MAEESGFYGTWKIVECVSLAGTLEPTGIEGTEFHLDESGDVSWKISEEAEAMPFFSCETYEVSGGDNDVLKFFGTFAGHIIEFKLEVSDDLMLLILERCCMLQCQRLSASNPQDEQPFSFLTALQEGYFSDLTLTAESKKQFPVQKTVLRLAVQEVNWDITPTPLCNLPEDVTQATLHYLYCECLPQGLSEDTAKNCIKRFSSISGFEKFCAICEHFLKNTALRQQMDSLVSDMHACADKIIDLFSGKVNADGTSLFTEESLMSNPARLCYVFKQVLRESSVAGAKLVILCDLFSRRKGELSRTERHDIIHYAKSRLPMFMAQLKRFLEVCKGHFRSLTASQRHDIAIYLVPEIETTLDTLSTFIMEVKTALDHVIKISEKNSEKEGKHKKGPVGDMIGKTLKAALHMKELMKLKMFHEKTTDSFIGLMQKRDNFAKMSQEEKIRFVARQLEHVGDEIPLFLVRIEEIMLALDQKLSWREWKYLFKLGTSKVAWGLNKIQTHRSTVESTIKQSVEMVHRDQFNASLATLGLIDHPSSQDTSSSSQNKSSPPPTTKYAQLSSVESLCVPPYARDSQLGKAALRLLHNADHTDMTFEILTYSAIDGDTVVDHTQGSQVAHPLGEVDVHTLPGHCVIMAARCDWFRRALLSGMKESIDKKITVHDTNPELFKLFLEYLYSGQVEMNELSTEQLADLLALSDRYEMESLKCLCENNLKHHMDDDSALFLLGLADQYHANTLKGSAMAYLKEHRHLLDSEIFQELPHLLQTTVKDMLSSLMDPQGCSYAGTHDETPSTQSTSSEVDELVSALELGYRHSPSSSSDELPFEDELRLEECIEALHGIVGDEVPREELVRVSLAADYDVNRALNFFFSAI